MFLIDSHICPSTLDYFKQIGAALDLRGDPKFTPHICAGDESRAVGEQREILFDTVIPRHAVANTQHQNVFYFGYLAFNIRETFTAGQYRCLLSAVLFKSGNYLDWPLFDRIHNFAYNFTDYKMLMFSQLNINMIDVAAGNGSANLSLYFNGWRITY